MTVTNTSKPQGGFAKLVAASTISNVGDGVFLVAVPLLATDITRDPTAIAGVVLAMRLPWFACSLVAGAVADRVDRRVLAWRTDVVRALVLVALSVAVVSDSASMALLYVVALCLGTAETFRDNAAQVIVPALVPQPHLESANGRLMSLETVANRFVGPPLGGLMVAVAMAVPFVFDAATFAAAAALVAVIPGAYRAPRSASSTRLATGIDGGLAWLWHHTQLRTLAMLLCALTCLATAGEAVLVLYAQDVLGIGDVGYGILIATSAIGAVSSGIVTARIVERLGRATVLIGAALVYGSARRSSSAERG
jgi:Transmembrane secretion effector